MGFDKNIFINCPLDEDYAQLLRAILFTIVYLGYNPRIASERFDSGETRISKICDIIKECKYGIHDLSRIKAQKKGEIFRFNMPFELGLDLGCKYYRAGRSKEKRILILEKEQYRYKIALSDLSNSDIKAHKNEPEFVIKNIRNWIVEVCDIECIGPTGLYNYYNDFLEEFDYERTAKGFSDDDIFDLPIKEYIRFIKTWLKKRL